MSNLWLLFSARVADVRADWSRSRGGRRLPPAHSSVHILRIHRQVREVAVRHGQLMAGTERLQNLYRLFAEQPRSADVAGVPLEKGQPSRSLPVPDLVTRGSVVFQGPPSASTAAGKSADR